MGVVMFYHLTRSGVEDVARTILNKAIGQGWRVMIRSDIATRLDKLDDLLWSNPEDGFIAHAKENHPLAEMQPVLLGSGDIQNNARALMLLDNAQLKEEELHTLERVWIIFDGANIESVSHARKLWKWVTELNFSAQYWSEESEKWQMKTQKEAKP